MSKIIVHGGDFKKGGGHSYSFGSLHLIPLGKMFAEPVPLRDLWEIELTLQESVKGYSKSVAIAATLISPIGAMAGMAAVGNKTEMTFIARFRGGRKMMATTDSATYKKLAGAAMDKSLGHVVRSTSWDNSDHRSAIEDRHEGPPSLAVEEQLCIECNAWGRDRRCVCGADKPADTPRRWSSE